MINVTLANVGTIICFRTANPEDEKLILPQFIPYVQQGEIANLPSFNFYAKINALDPEEPFSGITTPVEISIDEKRVGKIKELSRKLYTVPYTKRKDTTAKPNKRLIPKLVTESQPGNILP